MRKEKLHFKGKEPAKESETRLIGWRQQCCVMEFRRFRRKTVGQGWGEAIVSICCYRGVEDEEGCENTRGSDIQEASATLTRAVWRQSRGSQSLIPQSPRA